MGGGDGEGGEEGRGGMAWGRVVLRSPWLNIWKLEKLQGQLENHLKTIRIIIKTKCFNGHALFSLQHIWVFKLFQWFSVGFPISQRGFSFNLPMFFKQWGGRGGEGRDGEVVLRAPWLKNIGKLESLLGTLQNHLKTICIIWKTYALKQNEHFH